MTDLNVILGEMGLKLSELIVLLLNTKEVQTLILMILALAVILSAVLGKIFSIKYKAGSWAVLILVPTILAFLIFTLVVQWDQFPIIIEKMFKMN